MWKSTRSYCCLFDKNITYHVNPTGKFVIGGPHGDTGLTGRKLLLPMVEKVLMVAVHSLKDPSKVDRSALMTRHITKALVAAGCQIKY